MYKRQFGDGRCTFDNGKSVWHFVCWVIVSVGEKVSADG
jgi:hypothetical protein